MTSSRTIQSDSAPTGPPTTSEMIDRLTRFDGPPDQFLAYLLAVQCHIGPAAAGAILRLGAQKQPEVLAVHPAPTPGTPIPVWLAQSAEIAGPTLQAGRTAVRPLRGPDELYGQAPRQHLVLVPLGQRQGTSGLQAFVIDSGDPAAVTSACQRLELTAALLGLYEMRLTLQRRQGDLQRLRMALETLSTAGEPSRFHAAAMAFCNEVAARWQAQRVGVGLLKGRYVQLKALSHTEKFSRKMQLVQDVEAAMEECLDQDLEIVYPADPAATYVSRAAGELATRHGPSALLSLPLRRAGETVGVVCIERPADRPFTPDEVESLRLTCDLCTPHLIELSEHDRWIGARLAADIRKGSAKLLGASHTWIKLTALAALAGILLLIFLQGSYQVEAPFTLDATRRQVVAAPFDGYIKEVFAEPNTVVEANTTVLATLYTFDLQVQLAKEKARQVGFLKQADADFRDGKTADAQIAQAQAAESGAEIRLLEHQIDQARLVSPLDGTVIAGDLKKQIGAPVKTGDVLFEVAPLEHLRAELNVPEDQIVDVRENMTGELAATSYPSERVGFVVERINPVAEVVEQHNVFKVRVRLDKILPWMRPGMEGVAKITAGRHSYGWLWTRQLNNWVRMKLWW